MIDDEDVLALVDESDEADEAANEVAEKPKGKPTLNDLNRCARGIRARVVSDEKTPLEVVRHDMAKKRQAKKLIQDKQQQENQQKA